MKRLSIIVPFYNVENYLSKCLDSLLNQDIPLDDYEIIIINDGSTDSSHTIAESYLNQYQNIKLLNQENKGTGAARNVGFKNSEGKYVFFVDSDDYIAPNCLNSLLNCAEKNQLEILRFNYEAVKETGEIIPKTRNSTFSIVFSEEIVDGETFLSEQLGWTCYACMFFFDSSFIANNNFLFKEDIYFEDTEWLIRVMLASKRVKSLDKYVYSYLQRYGSITKSIQVVKKNKIISDKLFIVFFLKQISNTSLNKNVSLWCTGMISLTFMGILTFVENELPERKLEVIQLLRNQKFLPLKAYRFTLKQIRDLHLININPFLYCYLKRIK